MPCVIELKELILCRLVNGASRRLARQVASFRGARRRVAGDESESLIDPDFQFCDVLDQCSEHLRALRAELFRQQAAMHQGHSKVLFDAVKLLQRILADLGKEIQSLKTGLMEHDADRAPRDEGWTASTAEEIQRLFARL